MENINTMHIHIRYAQAKKRENRMINLLQENIKMKSQRTNSTFVFLPTHRQTLKKTKELFFYQRSTGKRYIKTIFVVDKLLK